MKIIKVVDILTKDDQETFELESVVGDKVPFAYHINHGGYGYAKFKIDDKSLDAFEKKLGKIESSMSRKHLYYVMSDMLVKNDISGARLLNICKQQLVDETAVDVLSICYNLIIPKIILHYIPFDHYF